MFFRFVSVDEMTSHHRKRDLFPQSALSAATSRPSSDVHIQVSPESELNYARLMQFNSCYEAMPTSSKMVVFDTNLQLKKAFNGLIYQNTRHVLLSDAEKDNAIVGILSVTDFIRVLLRLNNLLKAAQLLSKHRIHRLPVMDPYDGSPLFILTHKRILKFLWLFGQTLSIPDHHTKSCKELGVGTFDGIRV
ncbi:unnamed protein product, partial [Gongylonema pulchrum]|uniref:CBS domain-containing protein n=1 Tax=Gongylonema pulchrum TaxID=637853 RepID=A0A183E1F7_9BILA